MTPEGQRGCLVNNCLAELAPHDSDIMEATCGIIGWIESMLQRAVEQGQRDGTITRREPARALAHMLLNTQSGLNLRAKARPDKTVLEDIVRMTLKLLD